jgi:hypothetical protein
MDPVREYLPERFWNRDRDWFIYSVDYNTLLANAVAQLDQFTVENGADFLVMSMVVTATDSAGTTERTFLPYLCRITDSSSGQNWQNEVTHIQNVFQRINPFGPIVMEHPRFVAGGTTVNLELTNLSANADRVILGFRGIRIYSTYRS